MTRDRTENSRAPPMRHHGFKMARRVSDTYEMCNCFILSCYINVLIYRNIHFSKIYLRMLKLHQKFTLFWIFPRTSYNVLRNLHLRLLSVPHTEKSGTCITVKLFSEYIHNNISNERQFGKFKSIRHSVHHYKYNFKLANYILSIQLHDTVKNYSQCTQI